MKKQFGEYFIGLDLGTNSVGWAVTDKEYKLQKINGKHMWGIHLFEKGNTAAERRMARTARRRRDRQVQRIKLLQELFSEEVTKTDPGFFLRLKDSFFLGEDKSEIQTNTLFNDKDYKDKDFHKEYPTIYHLRLAFINGKVINDPRLLYLAVSHIIKNRGHFLFENFNADEVGSNFKDRLADLEDCLKSNMDLEMSFRDADVIKSVLQKDDLKLKDKVKELLNQIDTDTVDSDALKEILSLMAGGKGSLVKIFGDIGLEETKYKSIDLSVLDNEAEDSGEDSLEDILKDKYVVLETVKAICDWVKLSEILNGMNNLSEAKVSIYEKHKKDLKILKQTVKKYAPDKYKELFIFPDKEANYPAYIQMTKINGTKQAVSSKSCSQADFCKTVEKIIKNFPAEDKNVSYLLSETVNGRLMPRQKAKENSVIPYQLNEKELKLILENAVKNFPFLSERDEEGIRTDEKIMKLLTFRIPYYVGPLNDAHKNSSGNCWIVKKNGSVRPWNFDQMVDKDESAKQFIRKMTNKCTYLAGEDVLPKNSLLYTKFMVLDELNNLKLNGKSVSTVVKKKIFNDVFMKHYRVTGNMLRKYLLSEGFIGKNDEVSGFDGDFKSSLKPWLDFHSILDGRPMDENLIEQIIETITLFSGTDILVSRLKLICKNKFSDEEINKISKLKYKDWGRFSRKLLSGIYHTDKSTGECFSLIDMMENNSLNHMELLSSSYDFREKIKRYNSEINGINTEISYEKVNKLYASPAVKRTVWRALCIVKEIRKIMGHDPEKVFIEVPRGEGEKVRTISRKKQIERIYAKCKDLTPEIKELLKVKDDNELRSDKLFLYFIQKGRCMYSNEPITLEQLFDKTICDIDHIYPRSLTKDDSVLNNKVLCFKTINKGKSDVYPVAPEIQQKMTSFWMMLKDQKLITQEKFDRLVRTTELSNDELGKFISRQLVETGQASKAAAEILSEVFPKSSIVYSKPGNIDQFRQQFDIIKVRDLNDLHHAKDAYLNIVVGNIFDTKFTQDPRNFFAQKDHHYNLEKIFYYDVVRNGYYAWHAPRKIGSSTLDIVKKTIEKNDILFTRYSYSRSGKFFKTTPLPKGKGQFPLKTSDPRYLKTDVRGGFIYGGYTEVAGSYAFFVEHLKKGNIVRTIEFVPIYCKNKIQTGQMTLLDFSKEVLGLESPRILIDRINFDSLLVFDGFPLHLTGRMQDYILGKGAGQFHLPEKWMRYFKEICKFYNKSMEINNLNISEKSEINEKFNILFYQELSNKFLEKPYCYKKEFFDEPSPG
ncbi:MAG: type II CRISPR RNA-guided endonuclease Cas9, partial [Anaerolineaceae bacterium]|nr:type II CRISPR RNA-guided endonuclease Cas9 [Anaerolineaceae bacterium]